MSKGLFPSFALLSLGLLLCSKPVAYPQTAPFVHTQAAGPVSSTNATLNGMVVPNGANTFAWFEWGTNTAYGNLTAPVSVGNGYSVVRSSAKIDVLSLSKVFMFRLVASNSLGVACGAPSILTIGSGVIAMDSYWGESNVPLNLTNAVAIDAGGGFGLALKSDSTVIGWGNNSSGQIDVPQGLSNVVGIAVGDEFSVALKQDGTVISWGNSSFGQTNIPAGLSNVVAVSAGPYHTLALRADGKVVAWGFNYAGETSVPQNLSNVVSVAGGYIHSLALKADGTVISFGDNSDGQRVVPLGLTNVVGIAQGEDHCLAITADAKVVAWGVNVFGQTSVPMGLSNVLSVAGGSSWSIAVKTDLSARGWGRNFSGALGVRPELQQIFSWRAAHDFSVVLGNSIPRAEGQTNHQTGIQDFTIKLSSSDHDGDALRFRIVTLPLTGALYQWTSAGRGAPIVTANSAVTDPGNRVIFAMASPGSDDFTFLANDGLADSSVAPVHMIFASPWVCAQPPQPAGSGSARLRGTVVGATGGSMWFEWGPMGTYDQTTEIFQEGTNGLLSLVECVVTNLDVHNNYQFRVVASNSCGTFYSLPLLFSTGRRVVAWGPTRVAGQTNVPAGLSNVFSISATDSHSLALKTDGTVVAWGKNASGQCNVPQGLTNVLSVAAGYGYSLALSADRTVAAWGDNTYGQTNLPAGLSNVIAIAAGPQHCVAVKADGSLVTWGSNYAGETSVPEGLGPVVGAVAGKNYLMDYTMVLTTDGTVRGWGDVDVSSIPSDWTNVVALSSGYQHVLALKRDGTVSVWGDSSHGQLAVPAGLSNVIAVAGGEVQSLALLQDGQIAKWGGFGVHAVPAGLGNAVAISAGYHNLALGNFAPVSQSRTVILSSDEDVTIDLDATDSEGDDLSFRIVSLPATGALYQWTQTGKGSAITSADTPVDDVFGRVIFTPTVTNSSFKFVANDGLADSTSSLITITTVVPKARTQFAQPAGLNAVKLSASVVAGAGAHVWFEWWVSGGLVERSPVMIITNDFLWTRVASIVTNLNAQANYQFRIGVSNSLGTVYGATLPFTTGQRVADWGMGASNLPPGLSNLVGVASSGTNCLGLRSDGTLVGWATTAGGQIAIPPGLNDVVGIAVGGGHYLALKSDQTVAAWGSNTYGQINVPFGLSNVVQVAAGANHSLALRDDGRVIAWGRNSLSQTNVPASLTNAVSISSYADYNLAVTFDGRPVGWGSIPFGPAFPPVGATNLVNAAVGASHILATRSDGRVFGWGFSIYGAQNVPLSVSNVLVVACGANHSLALKADGTVAGWGLNNQGQTSIPPGLSNSVTLVGGLYDSLALAPNVAASAQSLEVVGAVGSDLIVSLTGSDPNNDPLQFRIVDLPTSGELFQFAEGGRGTAILLPYTAVTDLQHRVCFVPQPGSVGWPYDTFAFSVSDGAYYSTTATVTVNIIPAPVLQVNASSVSSNGAFTLSFAGVSNASYRAWSSTNLMAWTLLGPATQSSPGQFAITDISATNRPMRFYRVTCP